jgi:repressor LexA
MNHWSTSHPVKNPPVQLTPRQHQILEAIGASQQNRCYSPSITELANALGISRSTVYEHLGELCSKGLVSTCPGRARSSRLTSLGQELLSRLESDTPHEVSSADAITLAGQVAAGLPLEALAEHQALSWQGLFGHYEDLFSLQVQGDSMIEEDIHPGDYVICRRTCVAQDGELVVALVEGSEATLKRFYREKNRVRLEPANSQYQPIYTEDCQIEGVVVGLLRRLR